MFADLIEQLSEALHETVQKDLTGYRKTLVRKGVEILRANPRMRGVSKKKLQKWDLMPTWKERRAAKGEAIR